MNIECWTDGACSGNPGPGGSAAVIVVDGKDPLEVTGSLTNSTNNIAELTAIFMAVAFAENLDPDQITIYTDSKYCIGVLSKGWEAKKNTDLIRQIKDCMAKFANIKFVHVKGHAGNKHNERADELAKRMLPQPLWKRVLREIKRK